jgi:hypothetical protein
MSHNLLRISRLRDEYDRQDVEVLELRSPSSEDRLSDPRDQEADRKASIFDREPDTIDIQTVVWDLALDTKIVFDVEGKSKRELTVGNLNLKCQLESDQTPDDASGDMVEGAGDGTSGEETTDGVTVHKLTRKITEVREVQVVPDGFTGVERKPTTASVVTYEEGPINCSCGRVFEDAEDVYEHLQKMHDQSGQKIIIS